MRTETGVSPTRRRAPQRLALVLLALVTLATVVAPAQSQEGEVAPPWRDLEAAQQDLADLSAGILDAQGAILASEAELAALGATVDTNGDDTAAIAGRLLATQERARRLAVEAYINGGPVTDSLFVLDAASANDYAYRATLMSESAEAVASSQTAYRDLRDAASVEAIALAKRMEDVKREIIRAEAAIAEAETKFADLNWVITIAEIHADADVQMERWGRIEPTSEEWDQLRFCESTRDYAISTGNSYYGAYQFDVTTWVDMGGFGVPSNAPPEEQDARARYLYALRGSGYGRGGAWPVCGRFLPSG
jgi:hypothetical protein